MSGNKGVSQCGVAQCTTVVGWADGDQEITLCTACYGEDRRCGGRGEPASVSLFMPIYSNRWVHCSSYTYTKLFHIGIMYEDYLITNLSSENILPIFRLNACHHLRGK